MNSTIKKLSDAFKLENTTFINSLKLFPSALKEIAKLKANDNVLGFEKIGTLWYADIENWPLDKEHLLMVAGADDLLDELADGKIYIKLKITQHKEQIEVQENEALLELIQKDIDGLSGTYKVLGNYQTKKIWLCPVVNFVFLKVPKFIKFSKIEVH